MKITVKALVIFRYSNNTIDAYIDTCKSYNEALTIANSLNTGASSIEIIKEENINSVLNTLKITR